MKVTAICRELPAGTWIRAAVNVLEESIAGLRETFHSHPDEMDFFRMEITKATTELLLFQKEMEMKRTTTQLAGKFGRT